MTRCILIDEKIKNNSYKKKDGFVCLWRKCSVPDFTFEFVPWFHIVAEIPKFAACSEVGRPRQGSGCALWRGVKYTCGKQDVSAGRLETEPRSVPPLAPCKIISSSEGQWRDGGSGAEEKKLQADSCFV